jgi:hypothetical protein
MVDLPFGSPKSFNAELLSGLRGRTPYDSPPLPAAVVRQGAAHKNEAANFDGLKLLGNSGEQNPSEANWKLAKTD